MYKLLITKLEPLTEEEKKEVEMNRRNGSGIYRGDYPPQFDIPLGQKPVKVLEVVLTEEEYEAVKKAVVQVM